MLGIGYFHFKMCVLSEQELSESKFEKVAVDKVGPWTHTSFHI
jgi:hypothetical protein